MIIDRLWLYCLQSVSQYRQLVKDLCHSFSHTHLPSITKKIFFQSAPLNSLCMFDIYLVWIYFIQQRQQSAKSKAKSFLLVIIIGCLACQNPKTKIYILNGLTMEFYICSIVYIHYSLTPTQHILSNRMMMMKTETMIKVNKAKNISAN